jgi:uncharacterized protein DUF2442
MKRLPKVVTFDTQIDAALARAHEFEIHDLRVQQASYDRDADALCLVLTNGVRISIRRRYLQGLEKAPLSRISRIEILGGGTGLHWPQLNVSHYVPGLLNGIFGTRQWMAQLQQLRSIQ